MSNTIINGPVQSRTQTEVVHVPTNITTLTADCRAMPLSRRVGLWPVNITILWS